MTLLNGDHEIVRHWQNEAQKRLRQIETKGVMSRHIEDDVARLLREMRDGLRGIEDVCERMSRIEDWLRLPWWKRMFCKVAGDDRE